LEGEAPEVTAEWSLFTLENGDRAVVRLLDLAPDDPSLLLAENAKLDVNSVPVEVLAQVPGLSSELAGAIVAARATAPLASVEQLLSIEGIGPELLYGRAPDSDATTQTPGSPPSEAQDRGLSAHLTVFSFDPNVQLGLDGDDDARGAPRLCINQPWSDELRSALADRLGEDFAAEMAVLIESGRTFASEGDIAKALADGGRTPEEWGAFLDVLTPSRDLYIPGRLDINRAPRELLACIPGLTPHQAGRIADARDSLDAASKQSPVWPVVEGILTPDEFLAAAAHLTTRSMQWRVRLEAGMEPGDAAISPAPALTGPEDIAGAPAPESALRHRLVYEAVIDIASPRPRIAYLRDVTSLEPMLAMLLAQAEIEDVGEIVEPELPLADSPLPPEAGGDAPEEGSPPVGGAPGDPSAGPAPNPPPGGEEGPNRAAPGAQNTEPTGGEDRRIGRWNTRRPPQP
jgi:DNA uptake protein ComE-like DNA-binding protein